MFKCYTRYERNAMAQPTTTVKITNENWRRLNARKEQPGESFNDVIKRLLNETQE